MIAEFASGQNNPRGVTVDWKTNKERRLVPLNEFTALLEPDQIPPIYEPELVEANAFSDFYLPREPVISLEINGDARAYPLSVLMFHEIVNDEVGGRPVSVTYCPLCNAAIVYDRTVVNDGEKQVLDFGVSGMLRNSDLVMWDHQTESWWQQITGKALVGDLAGTVLHMLGSLVISMEEFTESYPDGKVLAPPSAENHKYGTNPYEDYDNLDNQRPFLYKGDVDERLPAMERVVDIVVDGKRKGYPYSEIAKTGVVNDNFNDQAAVIFYSDNTLSVLGDGIIKDNQAVGSVVVFNPVIDQVNLSFRKRGEQFMDTQTQSVWNISGQCIKGEFKGKQLEILPHGNHFAFALLAFYPDVEIYASE